MEKKKAYPIKSKSKNSKDIKAREIKDIEIKSKQINFKKNNLSNRDETETAFIGRQLLLQKLRSLTSEKNHPAQLICLYGRRRVGKTSLIEQAFKSQSSSNNPSIESNIDSNPLFIGFEGQEGGNTQAQIFMQFKLLQEVVTMKTPASKKSKTKQKTWIDFFEALLKNLPDKKVVLFFDEFQWMAEMRSELVSLFKIYWDRHFKKQKNLTIILCGSVSSFIVKKVIRSKALYGRIHHEIALDPLSLTEIYEFFRGTLIEKDFLKYAMCFGGVPEYLHRIDTSRGFSENLVTMAFTKNSYFLKEYHRLFTSHFGKSPIFERVVECLTPAGSSAQDIARGIGLKTGGRLTDALNDLCLAGLIAKSTSLDSKGNSKIVHYKINDEYLLLYKTLIAKFLNEIESGHFNGFDLINNKILAQWYGYAFERLCLKNAVLIAKALGFQGINYKCGNWLKKIDGTTVQIDLLFIRADKVITVCEIKHQTALTSKSIIEKFEKNVKFLSEYYPQHSIQKVLVTDIEVQNKDLRSYFHKTVNMTQCGSVVSTL